MIVTSGSGAVAANDCSGLRESQVCLMKKWLCVLSLSAFVLAFPALAKDHWEESETGDIFIYLGDTRIAFPMPDGYCPLSNRFARDRNLYGMYGELSAEIVVPLLFADCQQLSRWRNGQDRTLNDVGHVMAPRYQSKRFINMTREEALRYERDLQAGDWDPEHMQKMHDRMNDLLEKHDMGGRYKEQSFEGLVKQDDYAIYAAGLQTVRILPEEWKVVGIVHATTFVKGRVLYINLNSRLNDVSNFDVLWAKQETLVRRLINLN